MAPDPDRIAQATGLACSAVHDALCTREAGARSPARSRRAGDRRLRAGGARFEALAEDGAAAPPACVDIRDRAGWGEGDAAPQRWPP